jgi:FkbM family methyltransferase
MITTQHQSWLNKIQIAQTFATESKWYRFFKSPFKYINLQWLNFSFYSLGQKNISVSATTFWGEILQIPLPTSSDIYLVGAKTHDSEIRLAKFFIDTIKLDFVCIDVGAHIGYFTLLMAQLANRANVIAFEPSPNTFDLLKKNVAHYPLIDPYKKAIGNTNGTISFNHFDLGYSEFSAIDIDQYKKLEWNKKIKSTAAYVEIIRLNDFLSKNNINPQLIKIDVEGGEAEVVLGLCPLLEQLNCIIVMEVAKTNNAKHLQAHQLLVSNSYLPFEITQNGGLIQITKPIDEFLSQLTLLSDNIVYKKLN